MKKRKIIIPWRNSKLYCQRKKIANTKPLHQRFQSGGAGDSPGCEDYENIGLSRLVNASFFRAGWR